MRRQRPVRYIRVPARPTRQRVQQRLRPRRGRSGGGGGCLRIGIALAMAAFALISFFGSQVYNPITGEDQYITISQDQEIALGLQSAPEMAHQFGGLDPSPELQEIVDIVGQELVRNSIASGSGYPFEFHLLADTRTVNAFALPGGQIFITRALFDRLETEGQLAGVLAHEIVHVIARHGAERIAELQLTEGLTGAVVIATYDPDNPNSQTTAQVALLIGQLVNMKFGREDELQSDGLGVQIMADAGYDPNAMVEVMRILDAASSGARPPEFFSTHPNPSNRIGLIQEAIVALFPNGVPADLIP
ncbi:MAG: M48 family peptidase [Chloroflexi bacterium]|nr:MAG: M48 family peptidase [Chloroflexota bacterium]MBL1195231.1 M48 family peptidase [Chloroflexota bacterium]NOH12516.1 M48 family metalloprotease [Chloroflexota bacterium]